jgi:uncharacterized protein (DUF1697 family)
MSRYFAFLRAINVGGHIVKMETLRQLFESFGFSDVETFIASGNVVFHSDTQDAASLELTIASRLELALGYPVSVFIRNNLELAQIAVYQPFPQSELDQAAANNIAFLSVPLDEIAIRKLMALTNDIDRFAIDARQVYWLCRTIQSQSTFSNAVLEKVLGVRSTIRGRNTISKMVTKYVL